MIQDYIQQHYLYDLSTFHGKDIPQHGSFGMLCGMTMGKLFEPLNRVNFTSPADFLCCLYELNLINQGIYVYYPELHFEWGVRSLPFIDCRGCSSGHGGWISDPNSILHFAQDPSYIPRAQPVEIFNDQLKNYTHYFFNEYLPSIFSRQTLNPEELLERLQVDLSCPEVRKFLWISTNRFMRNI